MSEEYVISLVMKGDGSAPLELWTDVEQRGEQSSRRLAQPCWEIVENYFRSMCGDFPPIFLKVLFSIYFTQIV